MIRARIHPVLPLVMAALVLTGCARGGLPSHVLRLTPESLQNRALQTRKYEGISEADLLSASTGVIQDLGFIIDESETSLGLIVGAKDRDADPDAAQRAEQVLIGATTFLLGVMAAAAAKDGDVFDQIFHVPAVDDYQKLWASIVIRRPSEDNDSIHYVRVTFQRIVWNTDDEVARLQSLDEPEMYQRFFDLLSKSILLEGQEI